MAINNPGPEGAPVEGTRSFSDRPLVRFLKDRFSWKNLHEKMFGGNAIPGHFVSFAAGAASGIVDYSLDLRSEPTILTLAPVAVLVPSLLIPYQGYDKESESKQAHIITFGPMFSIGTTAGGIASSFALEAKGPSASRLALMESALNCIQSAGDRVSQLPCLDTLVTEAGPSMLTASNSVGLAGAMGVLIAYITVGYMSRDERWKYLSPLAISEAVKRVSSGLMERQEHKLADRLHKGILRGNQQGLQQAVYILDDLKTAAIDEPELTLDQLREQTVDDLGKDPTYFEKPEGHLSAAIIAQAQQDLVDYHYGKSKEAPKSPRQARGRRFLRRR